MKEAAQLFWGEAGKLKGAQQRKRVRWASDRLERLLLGLAGLVGDAGMEDWCLVRAHLEIDELKAVV